MAREDGGVASPGLGILCVGWRRGGVEVRLHRFPRWVMGFLVRGWVRVDLSLCGGSVCLARMDGVASHGLGVLKLGMGNGSTASPRLGMGNGSTASPMLGMGKGSTASPKRGMAPWLPLGWGWATVPLLPQGWGWAMAPQLPQRGGWLHGFP